MKTIYFNVRIYDTETRDFVPGTLTVDGGVITALGEAPEGECAAVDLGGAYLAPGLVDVHTHGRAGSDFASADATALARMSRSYLESGVTSVMPTLASAPLEELYAAADRIRAAKDGGAENFEGIHLEGRYLNPKRRGAHAQSLLASPDGEEIAPLIDKMSAAGAVHVSAALELDADGSFSAAVVGKGATLALAHTDASYAEARLAFERGARALTHTYNTMPPLHHREGGAIAAGLTEHSIFCELIADGFHVSPEMVKLAYMLKKDRLVLITDSMEATGCPDGEYSIAGLPVTVKDGKARTHEGAIAGSTLELIDGVKNLARFAGIPFGEALYNATMSPALMVGIADRAGSIEIGKLANLIVLDEEYNVKGVIFRGNNII